MHIPGRPVGFMTVPLEGGNLFGAPIRPVGKIRVKTCHIPKTLCRQRRPSRYRVGLQVSWVVSKSLELAGCIRAEEGQICRANVDSFEARR